jgi:hypothetical protein
MGGRERAGEGCCFWVRAQFLHVGYAELPIPE